MNRIFVSVLVTLMFALLAFVAVGCSSVDDVVAKPTTSHEEVVQTPTVNPIVEKQIEAVDDEPVAEVTESVGE